MNSYTVEFDPTQTQTETPTERGSRSGKLFFVGAVVLILLFFGTKLFNAAWTLVAGVTTSPAPVAVQQVAATLAPNITAHVEQMTASQPESKIVNGVTVNECTQTNDECASMTPVAGYTGNRPASSGWSAEGDLFDQCKAQGLALYELLTPDKKDHKGYFCGPK